MSLNALKELATSVVDGAAFDVVDITALQKVGQLPDNVDAQSLLDTVNAAKEQFAQGDYSALSDLVLTGSVTEGLTSKNLDSTDTKVPQNEDDLLVSSKVGVDEQTDDTESDVIDDYDSTLSSKGSGVSTFREIFGVGAGVAWDLPEIKFFNKILNKNSSIFTNATVKVGLVLESCSENGTLEIHTNKLLTDAELVDAFKVPLQFVTIKEKYVLFYVSADRQLVGECVNGTLYLF